VKPIIDIRHSTPRPVTSRSLPQRWLHTLVSGMCGRGNSCSYEIEGVRRWKIDYKSQPSAERAARDLRIKKDKRFDVYKCWFCGGWHVGAAHDLTPRKFLRILWFWAAGRKREGSKPR
jgi:hypothetical protein